MTTFIVHPSNSGTFALYIFDYNALEEGINTTSKYIIKNKYEIPDDLNNKEISDVYIVKESGTDFDLM